MTAVTNSIRNQTMAFYLEQVEDFLIHDLNLEMSSPSKLSPIGKAIAVSCNVAGLVVGSYFKSALYLYMYRNSKEIMDKPLDLLILIQAIFEHLVCTVMVIFYSVGLTFDVTYSDYFGEGWCNFPFYLSLLGVAYRNFGSLNLAILRVFYVKFPYQVKNDSLRKRLTFGTVFSCIAGSVFASIAFGTGNGPLSRKQVLWNFCTGKSNIMREIIHEYSLSRGTITLLPDVMPKIIVVSIFFGLLIEVACYAIVFHTMYAHDKEMLRLKRIPAREARKRYRRNAITFLGQFYSFVVESGVTMILGYTMLEQSDISYRLFIVIYRWVEFGILSIVEVMSSENLILHLPHKLFSRNIS